MNDVADLASLDEHQLRSLAAELMQQLHVRDEQIRAKDEEIRTRDILVDKLQFELGYLRRIRFGRVSEQLDATQFRLFEEDTLADAAAIEAELDRIVTPKQAPGTRQPRRLPLPETLPRIEIRHDPEDLNCACGCRLERIGEDATEKLEYVPGVFSVERHLRGRWLCRQCERITQKEMPPHIIDKGIAAPGLLAHVLVSKFGDHLPLNRLQGIYARQGVTLPISTLSDWVGQCGVQLQPLVDALKAELMKCDILHADETALQVLKHRKDKAGSHRAYLWVYASTRYDDLKAVVYDLTESRSGQHCRTFLGDWQGKLICDDYAGYKACFAQGITELGCMAHARRKFFEVFASNKSPVAGHALDSIKALYRIERKAGRLKAEDRRRLRQKRAVPILDALHAWLKQQRELVPPGSAIANAIDYSLRRWQALTRYVDDGHAVIDNNHCENLVRPVALGRKNWLFAGSLRAGQRAAAVMSLIQSAMLNGHDPYAYLKDVLTRLPITKHKDIGELLPHNWRPAQG